MQTWEVRPGEAIGRLQLGMTRAQARAEMGEGGETGRGDNELWFAGRKIRAVFDADHRVEFLEASSDAPLRVGDLEPFKLDRDEVVARVAALLSEPAEVLEDGATVQFESHGVVFWGYNQHGETEREFETIGVYKPGYYDA